jgi:regulator of sigma E protease
MLDFIINLLLTLALINILVFIHEFGHYAAALISGVTVEEFSIGMGPLLLGKEYKGIQYSLRALPIGGYVRILGEGDDPDVDYEEIKDDPGNFQNKSIFKKVFILLAGVTLNFLTAVIIFGAFTYIDSHDFVYPGGQLGGVEPIFGEVEEKRIGNLRYELTDEVEDSKAKDAGWPEEGYIAGYIETDKLEDGINKKDFKSIYDVRELNQILDENKDETLLVNICESNELNNCKPYETKVSEEGLFGIVVNRNVIQVLDYSDYNPVVAGGAHSINLLYFSMKQIGQIFQESQETGDYTQAVNVVSSPIGIFYIVGFLRDIGEVSIKLMIIDMLGMTALLSVILAFMNILPIPALDGGRVVLAVVESLTGDYFSKKVEAWLIRISFIALMLFSLLIVIKDIVFIDTLRNLFG